jgi:hypothetical protein
MMDTVTLTSTDNDPNHLNQDEGPSEGALVLRSISKRYDNYC